MSRAGGASAASHVSELAPGLQYRRADLAGGKRPIKWSLSLGVVRNRQETDLATTCAHELNLKPRLESFVFQGTRSETYHEVLAGEFPTRVAAQAYLDTHPTASRCAPAITASGMYPFDHPAPTIVHVLDLDPSRFAGQLTVARGDDKASGRTRPSTILRNAAGLAVTNGGFFVMEPTDGIVGESTGISVIAGNLQSEPSKGRPWALIENGTPIRVIFHDREPDDLLYLQTLNGERIMLDGVNRQAGLLRNCGALIDSAFGTAIHDVTCNPPDEIIAVTREGDLGAQASDGRVAYRFEQNRPLVALDHWSTPHADEIVLIATGRKRLVLSSLAASGQPLTLSLGEFGRSTQTYAVNGGPTLLADGKVVMRADVEGWPFAKGSPEQANAMHRFINMRAPRTALGVTSNGHVLIVVVDGWRYRHDRDPTIPMNGGATIAELASLMRDLGAQDALNLDGGGSSVMALRDGIVSHPSDRDGERAVGDALLLVGKR